MNIQWLDTWKYPDSFWQKLETELKTSRPRFAAFDADGTLWDTDLGENYFKWQIRNSKPNHLPPDPWKFYRSMKSSGDPRPAYLWLAQIHENQRFETVQSWCQAALDEYNPLPLFLEQKRLIDRLKEAGVEIFVVTASVRWSVIPGARLFGIPDENVLGVETVIQNGRVTKVQKGSITYKEGKVAALLERTSNRPPFLTSGNSPGDLTLLENATQFSLVVSAAPKEHELFESEQQLRKVGEQRGWTLSTTAD